MANKQFPVAMDGLTTFLKNPLQYYNQLKSRSVTQALEVDIFPLSKIKILHGDIATISFMNVAIINLIEYFSIGKSMSDNQVLETSLLILQKYPYLKPSEIKFCFDNAKMGEYGRIYDRLDGGVIFEWLEKYEVQRTEAIETRNHNQHIVAKKGIDLAPNIISILKKAVDEVEVEKRKPVEKKQIIHSNKLIQSWYDEFDKIHKKQDTGEKGQRFIKYKKKTINQSEFIAIKLLETTAE